MICWFSSEMMKDEWHPSLGQLHFLNEHSSSWTRTWLYGIFSWQPKPKFEQKKYLFYKSCYIIFGAFSILVDSFPQIHFYSLSSWELIQFLQNVEMHSLQIWGFIKICPHIAQSRFLLIFSRFSKTILSFEIMNEFLS